MSPSCMKKVVVWNPSEGVEVSAVLESVVGLLSKRGTPEIVVVGARTGTSDRADSCKIQYKPKWDDDTSAWLTNSSTVLVTGPFQDEGQAKSLIQSCKACNVKTCIITTDLLEKDNVCQSTKVMRRGDVLPKPCTEKDTKDRVNSSAENVVLQANGQVMANGETLLCVSLRIGHLLPTASMTSSSDKGIIFQTLATTIRRGGLVLLHDSPASTSWTHPKTAALALVCAAERANKVAGEYLHVVDFTCSLYDVVLQAWQDLPLYLVPVRSPLLGMSIAGLPCDQAYCDAKGRQVLEYNNVKSNGGVELACRQEIFQELREFSKQLYDNYQRQQSVLSWLLSYVLAMVYILYHWALRIFGFGEYNIGGAIIAITQAVMTGQFDLFNPQCFVDRHSQMLAKAKQSNDFSIGVQNYYGSMVPWIAVGAGQYCHFVPIKRGCSVSKSQEYFNQRVVNRLLPIKGRSGRETVLEVGCGQGHLGREVARISGADVTGLTFATNEVELATLKASRQGLQERYKCVRGDYHKLPFEDNSFSAVFGIYCLKYSSKLETVLGEMARVCKPGGYVWSCEIVVTDTYDPTNPEHKQYADIISDSTHMPPLHSLEAFREAAEAVGLELVCQEEDLGFTQPESWTPWYSCMARNGMSWTLQQKWLDSLVQTMEAFKVLPKGFTRFYQEHLVHPLVDFVLGGKVGCVSGSTVMVWRKRETK